MTNCIYCYAKIPKEWNAYTFKVNFRNAIVKVEVNHQETKVSVEGDQEIDIVVNGKPQLVKNQ